MPDVHFDEPLNCKAARLVLALRIARICEMLPLPRPQFGGELRIIAFINDGAAIREILVDLGEPTSPPRLFPAHGPPMWDRAGVEPGDLDRQFHRHRTKSSISGSRGNRARTGEPSSPAPGGTRA